MDHQAIEAVVVFPNETQTYYTSSSVLMKPDYERVDLFALGQGYPNPADALAYLQASNVSYLLVNEADIRWWQRGDPEGRLSRGKLAFDRLTARLELVYRDGPLDAPRIIIYRVPPSLNDDNGCGARFR